MAQRAAPTWAQISSLMTATFLGTVSRATLYTRPSPIFETSTYFSEKWPKSPMRSQILSPFLVACKRSNTEDSQTSVGKTRMGETESDSFHHLIPLPLARANMGQNALALVFLQGPNYGLKTTHTHSD